MATTHPARCAYAARSSVTRRAGSGGNTRRPVSHLLTRMNRASTLIPNALDRDAPAAQTQRTKAPPPPYTNDSFITLTRGQLVRKDVVTRTGGTRLGNVSQLWVDTTEWEVVALDCRPVGNGVFSPVVNAVGGGQVDHVLMTSLRQVGDVILVHDENAVERRWSSYGLQTVVGCDVVTERGTYIGRVRDFEFDPEDGLVQRLIVDALGLPVVPEEIVSTYAIDVSEILSSGMDRIIVADGAEARVEQLSSSLLQRLKLTAPPWEDDLSVYGDYYASDYAAYEAYEREQRNQRERVEWEQRQRQSRQFAEQRDAYAQREEPQGIPLVRPNQQYERKDADGGYGYRPPVRFDDYLEEEQRQYEYEYEMGGDVGANSPKQTRRQSLFSGVSSPPPPPPEAWNQAAPPARANGKSTWDAAGGSVTSRGFDASEDLL